MSALRSIDLDTPVSLPDTHSGAGGHLFTSGSAPRSSSILDGGGTALFTTSCGPRMAAGQGTALYTTSCIESGRSAFDGDGVALFTTSC
ncbi:MULTISPECIES: DUF6749 family protein [unclassified Sulfitobacter]|uniref:DUF6749 family protein n=1 Tax=unclassified Sulfitobacter TaxID=196795 RepID=UPI0007C2AE0A|nr:MULTISPECIES: DUF6749 family protein [unclassified Sulfitobacter]KZY23574.1 hypothetical protein A3728_08175 [Sulfitobacter sp. HI0040]KZZ69896.1 hypothetical protein A3764_09400 [Sulfitobacter sp. HI0129]